MNEKLIETIEGTANFLRGMCFDRRLHPEIKAAVECKVQKLDKIAEEALSAAERGE